jgi:hypothetical protein
VGHGACATAPTKYSAWATDRYCRKKKTTT